MALAEATCEGRRRDDAIVLAGEEYGTGSARDWAAPENRAITFVFGHDGQPAFALLLNAAGNGVTFSLPRPPHRPWVLELASDPQVTYSGDRRLILAPRSFALLSSTSRRVRRA